LSYGSSTTTKSPVVPSGLGVVSLPFPGVSAIVSNVIDDARNGSIVVMHDGGGDRSETIAALPSILSHFRNRGYTFVTVADLLGHHFIYRTPPAA
jgi:peptidoglycan/xylan/chitin deacetylase (PgdA/CDA1 family)